MSKDKVIVVYTREGSKELTWDEWYDFDNSKLYREGDLPVVETVRGSKRWYKYGKEHRETGPAMIGPNGNTYHYLAGKYYLVEDFNEKLQEADELPLTLALTHPEEWVRDRAKNRTKNQEEKL